MDSACLLLPEANGMLHGFYKKTGMPVNISV
jgi:hypothetical protein